MSGGSGGSNENVKKEEEMAAAQQPVAQALQMAQYPAYMPGQQEALASQMANFYGPGDYASMLGANTQSASRPTLRNPTDIETYLNNLANPGGGAAAQGAQTAQAANPAVGSGTGPYLAGDSGARYPTSPDQHQYGVNFFGR